MLIDCVFTFIYYAAAFLILWKAFHEPMGLLAALALIAFGTSFPSLMSVAFPGHSLVYAWFMFVSMLGWVALSLLFFLFPNGAFVPRWTRGAFAVIACIDFINLFFDGSIWRELQVPAPFQLLWYGSSTLVLIYSQVYRYRKVSTPAQRQRDQMGRIRGIHRHDRIHRDEHLVRPPAE
ncbi:hypothetical protein LJK87_29265 [Paenibacillus sp. P25]|nr:hypothetical protein LJK87_29265 [Paenibacillus sp. P25]